LNKALADAIRGAHFQLIPGAAHLPCVEQPAILSAHVASFVGNHAHV
jgi:3-oxoadipate enol-lactonase